MLMFRGIYHCHVLLYYLPLGSSEILNNWCRACLPKTSVTQMASFFKTLTDSVLNTVIGVVCLGFTPIVFTWNAIRCMGFISSVVSLKCTNSIPFAMHILFRSLEREHHTRWVNGLNTAMQQKVYLFRAYTKITEMVKKKTVSSRKVRREYCICYISDHVVHHFTIVFLIDSHKTFVSPNNFNNSLYD